MKKRRSIVLVLVLVLAVVTVAAFLTACNGNGGSNSGDNSGVLVGETPPQNPSPSQNSNKDSYEGLLVGWGKVGETLTQGPKPGTQWSRELCVIDAELYMRYVEAQENYGRTGLRLVDSGTSDPGLIQCSSIYLSKDGTHRLVPNRDKTIISYDGGDNLFEKEGYGVYWSESTGVITWDEWNALPKS
jgi:hypothetical protein